ncbi:hypothetical protein DRZ77_02465 [Candidatus Woesearchaeota archaeon]|nr:hypothetical protein [Candidatus Woesearchaeota archaeon]RLE40357.1 MAG: hypothetical protein DRZ77_02465 [Candidatus Woesearchaeota archaeon]
METKRKTQLLGIIRNVVLNASEKCLFLFIGILTKNFKHDIDLLFLANPNESPTHILKAFDAILVRIKDKFKRINIRTVFFNTFYHQSEISYISKYKPGNHILIHALLFFDTRTMHKVTPYGFVENIAKVADHIHGNPNVLLEIQSNPRLKFGHVILARNFVFNSNLPLDFVKQKTSFILSYVLKWWHPRGREVFNSLKNKFKRAKTEQELKRIYFYISEEIEKSNITNP